MPALDLPGHLDLHNPRPQSMDRANLRLTNAAYFAAYDKSDEALLNDYEKLLLALRNDQQSVSDLFERIIRGLILDNPQSVIEEVEKRWGELPVPDRLVAESPIPLNEEQRKILDALRTPSCSYLAIQGPPGTGKSHTITAIAFDCILAGKNVLVLSDKQEALDVVESKLKEALAAVRHGDEFPEPILRLGRTGGTYAKLITQTNQTRIREHYRAVQSNLDALMIDLAQRRTQLKTDISGTVDAYTRIPLADVEDFHRLEQDLARIDPIYARQLHTPHQSALQAQLHDVSSAIPIDGGPIGAHLARYCPSGTAADLLRTVRILGAVRSLDTLRQHQAALGLFTSLDPSRHRTLQEFLAKYEALRMPVLGFLFRGRQVRALNARLGAVLPCTSAINLHQRLADLCTVNNALTAIQRALHGAELDDQAGQDIYRYLLAEHRPPDLSAVSQFLELYRQALGPGLLDAPDLLRIDGTRFRHAGDLLGFLALAARYAARWHTIRGILERAPRFDYVGEKTQLERLYTSRMAHEIDGRFIGYVENERTTAHSLARVIRAK